MLGQDKSDYISTQVFERHKLNHDVYCPLCGSSRKIMVSSSQLTKFQHLQIVLASVFLAWALFPVLGKAALFFYPFIWMGVELGKKAVYRKAAQCNHCGFDAMIYVKDVKKAQNKIKTHLEQMPKQVYFKRGYGRDQTPRL